MRYLCQLSGVRKAGTWWRLIIFLPMLQKKTSFVLRSCNEINFAHRRSQSQHIPLKTSLHEENCLRSLKSQIKKKSLSLFLKPLCPYTYVCTCECRYESIHTHIYILRPNKNNISRGSKHCFNLFFLNSYIML